MEVQFSSSTPQGIIAFISFQYALKLETAEDVKVQIRRLPKFMLYLDQIALKIRKKF